MFTLLFLVACGPDPENGGVLYGQTCVACHGTDGSQGTQTAGVAASDLNDVVPAASDEELVELILEGKDQMPAQLTETSDAEDVVAYLRETFG